jgi:hypothetical protein
VVTRAYPTSIFDIAPPDPSSGSRIWHIIRWHDVQYVL